MTSIKVNKRRTELDQGVSCTTGTVGDADSPPTLSHSDSFKPFTEGTNNTKFGDHKSSKFWTMTLPYFKTAVFGTRWQYIPLKSTLMSPSSYISVFLETLKLILNTLISCMFLNQSIRLCIQTNHTDWMVLLQAHSRNGPNCMVLRQWIMKLQSSWHQTTRWHIFGLSDWLTDRPTKCHND